MCFAPPRLLIAMCALTLAAAVAVPAAAEPATQPTTRAAASVTQEQVDAAIAKGQKFLLAQRKGPARWEPDVKRRGNAHDWQRFQGETWGGFTAVATYALLASGMSPQDQAIVGSIEFLKKADIVGVYALGMRAQVWTFLPQTAETQRLYRKDLELILKTLNTQGPAAGLWDYVDFSPKGGQIDHSLSQFGVLGLWACAHGGVDVSPKLWETFDDVWKRHQYDDGGWSYDGNGRDSREVTPAMTAAGIATLFITQEYVAADEGLDCDGNPTEEHIARGIKWMSDHFAEVKNNTYLWYGVERIGAASGRKYFGDHDWYAIGTADVLGTQQPNGSWRSSYPGSSPIPDTAFALLFLSRGRSPIVMNKLDHGVPGASGPAAGDWNQRPGDVAYFTRWMSRQTERYLGWQVVDLNAPAQDLLDAPILYLSGSSKLALDDAQVAKLRQLVEDGGLILGNADCGKAEFARSFQALGQELFPAYKFRELPAKHPILAGQQFRAEKWKGKVSVLGLSNGSRELMLLLPDADAGRAWHQQSDKSKDHLFQLGANIYLYATDKRTDRIKGQTHVVKDNGVKPFRTVKVARLNIGGNWDPEPGGWRRLALAMKNEQRVGLEITVAKLGDGTLLKPGTRIAHLTGTEAFELNAKQRGELRQFVTGAGGTLLVDAAGGSAAFADAAEKELAETFGPEGAKQLASPIPPGHPLFTNAAGPIQRVAYRRTASQELTGDLKSPRLRGITYGKRLGVIFSREDLSTGLVGHAVDGVIGYDPPSATQIVRNAVLLANGINKSLTSGGTALD